MPEVRKADLTDRLTTLRDGTRVLLRPILPEDKERLVQGFKRLSPESRYRRFMMSVDELSPETLTYLTEIDYDNHFAVVALALDEPGGPGIGVARYVREKDDPTAAEAAVTVIDDYQGRGVGRLLLQSLGETARDNGITKFRGYFLSDNSVIRKLLADLGARFYLRDGVPAAEVDLPKRRRRLRDTPVYRVLRAVARGDVAGIRPPVPSGPGDRETNGGASTP